MHGRIQADIETCAGVVMTTRTELCIGALLEYGMDLKHVGNGVNGRTKIRSTQPMSVIRLFGIKRVKQEMKRTSEWSIDHLPARI